MHSKQAVLYIKPQPKIRVKARKERDMAKRFKFRISRVISSSFQSCRSKHPTTIPSNPIPSFFKLNSPLNAKLINFRFSPVVPPHKSQSHPPTIKRHVSSAFISVGCGFRPTNTLSEDDDEFQWEKEDKWHVIAKVYHNDTSPRLKIHNSVSNSGNDNLPPPISVRSSKRRVRKKKATTKEETETLVSSSSCFSTDSSSDFSPHLEIIREAPTRECENRSHRKKSKKQNRRRSLGTKKRWSLSSGEMESPARLSRMMGCKVEGKVRESFAVVKKSEDPYEDFRRSMMEMIVEKQMFEEKELEQLLNCFLSLNSSHLHGVIVEAFSEIWETLF